MTDYKELYKTLFSEVSKAIETLQAAQLACEEVYMREGDAPEEQDAPPL